METVTYEGIHRRKTLFGQWKRAEPPLIGWIVFTATGDEKHAAQLVKCPPSWEATKRLADEINKKADIPKKHRSKPHLKVCG